MTTVNQDMQLKRDKFHEELDRLLKLLAAQQRLSGTSTGNSTPGLQRGETAEAQAVLAAYQRLIGGIRSNQAHQGWGERRAPPSREIYGNPSREAADSNMPGVWSNRRNRNSSERVTIVRRGA
jgi:hypothetical protein